MLFADDILLFGEASLETVLAIQNVLNLFCGFSGQTVSLEKSSILFSQNTPSSLRQCIIEQIGIKESENLSPYLGFLLVSKRRSKREVSFIVQKMKKKMSTWKSSCLSKAGKLVLVQFSLNSIPNYYMQSMLLPASCLEEMNRVMARFLWGKGEEKGIHLVK